MNKDAAAVRAAEMRKIRQLPNQVGRVVAGLSVAQLTTHYIEGEWTVAQNVHHLADSHMNSYVRCKLMMTEDNPTLRPYDQDRWAAALPDANSADLTASTVLLRGLHGRWAYFWELLSAEDWQRTGFHPESGTVTLADQLHTYARHGEAHLDQIRRTLASAGK